MNVKYNTLYRIFNPDGALLYVGATANPGARLTNHEQHQPWWGEASEIKLQQFETLEELALAEIEAIRTEAPRYNTIHTDKPRISALKPRNRRRSGGTVYQRLDGLWAACLELPREDGKRRRRVVCAQDRAEAERLLAELIADQGH